MCDSNKWFDYMRNNINFAQKHFESNNFDKVDYYLSHLSIDIKTIREMYGRKACESTESSDGS